MKILLIEDDDTIIKVLNRSLTAHRYVVDTVKDGEMGWTYGSTFEYDLILLDVMLPKLDGISLCKRFRTEGYTTPILLLTAQDTRLVKVQGLDAGADDYVVKPFDQVELIARIRALVRRGSANPLPLLSWGDLCLNPTTCEVSYAGRSLTLTTKEYELLELLLRDSGHVFSSDELIDRLWSSEDFPSEATVRSHLRRLRHKLIRAGAPADFIANLHGRGYYLKPTSPTPGGSAVTAAVAIAPTLPTVPDSTPIDPLPTPAPTPATRQQYLEFLNETWRSTQPKSLAQIEQFTAAIAQLETTGLTETQQAHLQRLAHTLAGTLSIFGLTKATHLARQMEYWLGSPERLQPKQAPLLKTMVTAFQQEILQTTTITLTDLPDARSPLLLVISAATPWSQALITVATRSGLAIATAPTPEAARSTLATAPQVILLHYPAPRPDTEPTIGSTLTTLRYQYPDLPILVVGDRDTLADRLAVLRGGGQLFLAATTPPDDILSAIVQLLSRRTYAPKVMVVDDDDTWLNTLPTLLKPWGFKVTTLDDPRQFWAVLQSVTPDVLILDVNMPHINGLELCQVLRSDPHWQRLPLLFLSVLSDPVQQQQAFLAGADDYLVKPMMGVTLAHRILSRLDRVRACTG